MIPPFDYPEIKSLFGHLLDSLLEESGRGAVLIGTTHVDDYLLKLISDSLPSQDQKFRSRLFNYPGPLSSFSARIELAFAFRLIHKNLYDALNELRKVRNDAAHSAAHFSLVEFKDRMTKVYELGPGFPDFVRTQAMKMLVSAKVDIVKKLFEENDIPQELRAHHIQRFTTDDKLVKSLEEQAPHWELIFGISFMCGFLMYIRERTLSVAKENIIWSSFAG
jgi:hypothetical protein